MKNLRRLLFASAVALAGPLFGQQVVGNLTVQQYVRNADGTAAAPSFRFTTDPNTGFYSYGADQIGIAANGLAQGYFGIGGLTLLDSGDGITFHGTTAITGATGVLTLTGTVAPNATGNGFGTAALRWGSSYFSGPIYIGAASGTSPTITATGSSPNESLVFTNAGTGSLVLGGITSITTGSESAPGLYFAGDPNTGLWQSSADSFAFTVEGTTRFNVTTTAADLTVGLNLLSGSLTGGAGNMTITSGTGNSRTLTLRTTTSGGTATTALLLSDTQTVAINSTSPIAGVRTATATLNYGSILAAALEDLTITVTGAAVGMSVEMGLPTVVAAGIIFNAWVSASDTVTIRANNAGSIAADPASATYRATVISF